MKKYLPNLITMVRIIGTLLLLFVEPFTALFFFIYTVSGISDALDGWIARHWNLSTEFGARLDSIADVLFYSVTTLRIFPRLWEVLPWYIWACVVSVIIGRIFIYLFVFWKFHRLASLHTYLNKAAGFTMFLIPYMLAADLGVLWCGIASIANVSATLEELLIHLHTRTYDVKNKSIFYLLQKSS